jgi:hypothetical protein
MATPEPRPFDAPAPLEGCTPKPGDDSWQRAPWCKPHLEAFGDVRTLTMGGTIGINESGNPTRFP